MTAPTAPTTKQVLENAARTASERQARLARLDAGWRVLAHTAVTARTDESRNR